LSVTGLSSKLKPTSSFERYLFIALLPRSRAFLSNGACDLRRASCIIVGGAPAQWALQAYPGYSSVGLSLATICGLSKMLQRLPHSSARKEPRSPSSKLHVSQRQYRFCHRLGPAGMGCPSSRGNTQHEISLLPCKLGAAGSARYLSIVRFRPCFDFDHLIGRTAVRASERIERRRPSSRHDTPPMHSSYLLFVESTLVRAVVQWQSDDIKSLDDG
jgi:hypothetical protein